MNLLNRRIAVMGTGRSGVAVAEAAKVRGADVLVLDQKHPETPEAISIGERLIKQDIEVFYGWTGQWDGLGNVELFVISPGVPVNHPAVLSARQRGITVWGEIEFAYRITDLPVVAVTGTNGKSTTVVMTWSMLQAAGVRAVLCGNIAGSGYPEVTLTEAASAAGDAEVFVAEISSFQLETIEAFHPQVAAITNITPDHLDRHRTFNAYRDAKLRLAENMGAGDAWVADLDAPTEAVLPLPDFRDRGMAVTELHSQQNITAEAIKMGELSISREQIKVFGDFNARNVLMAWALATATWERLRPGEPVPAVAFAQALRDFSGLAHRLEFVGERDGVWVINNSMCTNPAALAASIAAIPRRQHLLIGGITKDLDFHSVGAMLVDTKHVRYYFAGDRAALESQIGPGEHHDSLASALHAATQAAKPGEAIVLAPGAASAAPYPNFGARGIAFRQMAKEWLNS